MKDSLSSIPDDSYLEELIGTSVKGQQPASTAPLSNDGNGIVDGDGRVKYCRYRYLGDG